MSKVDDYMDKLTPEQAAIAKPLRAMITSEFPELIEQFKWNQPLYEKTGQGVVYFVATKSGINLGFNHGVRLDDPKKLLSGTGQLMRHIKLSSVDDIDNDYFSQLIRQSLDIV